MTYDVRMFTAEHTGKGVTFGLGLVCVMTVYFVFGGSSSSEPCVLPSYCNGWTSKMKHKKGLSRDNKVKKQIIHKELGVLGTQTFLHFVLDGHRPLPCG